MRRSSVSALNRPTETITVCSSTDKVVVYDGYIVLYSVVSKSYELDYLTFSSEYILCSHCLEWRTGWCRMAAYIVTYDFGNHIVHNSGMPALPLHQEWKVLSMPRVRFFFRVCTRTCHRLLRLWSFRHWPCLGRTARVEGPGSQQIGPRWH